MDGIENVYIYVSDALRYDALPANIREDGVTFKTVAQSTYSPPSFSTLATGRYPDEHGVWNWEHTIPENIQSIFDLTDVENGFCDAVPPERASSYHVLGEPERTELQDVEPPFVHLHRRPVTHQPFRRADDVETYIHSIDAKRDKLKRDYERAAAKAVEELREQMARLQERSILENTLVIFTGDHGELLGERGAMSHVTPICPELAYVPTVFIHEGLSADAFAVDPEVDLVEHVDVMETALSAAGVTEFATSGTNLLERQRPRDWGYCTAAVEKLDRTMYAGESIWGTDGGVVFHTNARLKRFATCLNEWLRVPERFVSRRHPLQTLRSHVPATVEYGTPPFEVETCRDEISALRKTLETVEPGTYAITDEMEARLEHLGYIDK